MDSTFDAVLKDYYTLEKSVVLSKDEYEDLLKEIEKLKKQVIDLKVDIDNEKSKNKYLKKGDSVVPQDNLELLKRIGKLEYIIHEKLHLNPDDAINFDPDDCWH